jgi:tRNA (guanine-N7-)-methyltransferase
LTVRKTRRLPLEELSPYLLALPDAPLGTPPPALDWRAVFGNDHPVELEVGFGKGLFLVKASTENPTVNYVGVEIERKLQLYVATRMAVRHRTNVRLVVTDARDFVRDRVPSGSLRGVHVYFPDPWWKKRHHKRRVFTEEFAVACERMLAPGGRLHLATDVGEYFEIMTGLVAERTGLVRLPPPDEHAPAHDMDYLSNFERKARQKGQPVYRAEYEKRISTGEPGA